MKSLLYIYGTVMVMKSLLYISVSVVVMKSLAIYLCFSDGHEVAVVYQRWGTCPEHFTCEKVALYYSQM